MSLPNLNAFSGLLAQESIWGANPQLIKKMINSDSGQVLYIGWNSNPAAATSDSTWAIAQCLYDGNGFLNAYNLPITKGFGPYYVWDNVTTYF